MKRKGEIKGTKRALRWGERGGGRIGRERWKEGGHGMKMKNILEGIKKEREG